MLELKEKLHQILECISTDSMAKLKDIDRTLPLVEHLLFHGYIKELQDECQEKKYELTDKGIRMLKNTEKKVFLGVGETPSDASKLDK
ncbi:hypothetical protein [Macrococcoides caseolyticum]|uniref:hypothetical protein n=1 Tax=Macrococcoides caseolyticum TaxID=69966 RepID=UPI001C5EE8B2|nr:hypothetical protein [Macrococcus caseolyticus]QYA35001.1 hypothetical protein KYI08_10130 [Macrococcus caseolyticus]